MKRPRGAWRRGNLLSLLLVSQWLLAGCTFEARRHARPDWRDGAWALTDLGSAGGTYVNGRRVQQHALRPGEEVRLGETLLRFG